MNWKKHVAELSILLSLSGFGGAGIAQVTLNYERDQTVTWEEAIAMYTWMDRQYDRALLVEAGWTDAGKPLHLFIISRDQEFTPEEVRRSGKTVLFINNGIHPGEPCGIDASLELAQGLLSGSDEYDRFLENTVVVIVPIFNVGGALNRSPYHRANQNGPREQGFRGNARNLDLNRDLMKLDSRNARSLVSILRDWDPEIFVDTHTSNGADYAYAITLINSHQQRHEPSQALFLDEVMLPALFDAMKETPYEMSPYVWSLGNSPEEGIIGFMDYPRYTSGYVSLFNTLALTVETHMFKPYSDRVRSTWHLLREVLKFSSLHGAGLKEAKAAAWKEKLQRDRFTLQWELDTSRFEMLPFKGYRSGSKLSSVTGYPRQYYDRNDPWEKEIPYYRYFKPVVTGEVPDYFILPAAWGEAVERLKINRVEMIPVPADTVMELEVLYIDGYGTSDDPNNGHYRHFDVTCRSEVRRVRLLEGDLMIPSRQRAIEYLVQALDPRGYDSFFSWNFFDEILFRNEYFSPYIFEESAELLLREDTVLRTEFQRQKQEDPRFAGNPYQQLRFIYERSPWSEESFRRYPVYRLFE